MELEAMPAGTFGGYTFDEEVYRKSDADKYRMRYDCCN